eukprot:TRINITY_DN7489_c0_g1_i1.p1 TRINITY_DN7489_c0_g1~~TRINITY_DN7489_c0_g1_i1.p1  ORF type:complete len:1920 (+),score=339.39 TRINITY_DN7489_c0_g1_i1:80-5761(+)
MQPNSAQARSQESPASVPATPTKMPSLRAALRAQEASVAPLSGDEVPSAAPTKMPSSRAMQPNSAQARSQESQESVPASSTKVPPLRADLRAQEASVAPPFGDQVSPAAPTKPSLRASYRAQESSVTPLLRLLAGLCLSCVFHQPSILSLVAWTAWQQAGLRSCFYGIPTGQHQHNQKQLHQQSATGSAQVWSTCCPSFFTVTVTEALLFDVVLRAARLVFAVAHEVAHVLAFLVLLKFSGGTAAATALMPQQYQQQSVASFWQLCRCIELSEGAGASRRAKPKQLWTILFEHMVPGSRAPGLHVQLPTAGLEQHQWQQEVIRCSGVLISVFIPVLLMLLLPEMTLFACAAQSSSLWEAAIFLGAVAAAAGALLSDLPGGPLLSQTRVLPTGVFCCGNWGCLVPRECLDSSSRKEFFPHVLEQLLSNLLNVVELRGAQAGGCATYLRGSNGQVVCMRSRTVKSKRGRLAPMLFGKLHRNISSASWSINPLTCFQRLKPLPVVLAQGHSRFGTSSVPAENETHPHQWLGPHCDRFWRQELGKNSWKLEEQAQVCITITHNGDFDGWKLFDEVVANGDLGEWISRMLHKRNEAKGDSPKLAGLMDVLLVQGRWAASVRLAFIRTVLKHVDQICDWEELGPEAPNVAPAPQVFRAWAKPFEKEFALVAGNFVPTEAAIQELGHCVYKRLEAAEWCLGDAEAEEELIAYVLGPDLGRIFCQEACRVFFANDLMSAVWDFFSCAEGTFGISVTCSLWPQKIALAAKGQPISLAFDSQRPLVYWASEPASLAQLWPGRDGDRTPAGRVRWDMMDDKGEALELQMVQGGTASGNSALTNKYNLEGTLLGHAKCFPLPSRHSDDEERPFHVLIRGVLFNSSEPTPLTSFRFLRRSVQLSIADRLDESPTNRDVVGCDISNVPKVLAEIDTCWQDRNSLNRISALTFANCLGALLNKRSGAGSDIDVLIFGIENSLWLGQQFAADLARLFPCLNVVAMSSNWVLGMLQSAEGHVEPLNWTLTRRKFKLSPGGIALGISQSGTTYPSVWSSRLLRRLVCRPEVFAMAGHFDTVMANGLAGGDIFSGKLFSTLSGISPAEPSTLATMAMHHTLTKLLLFCTEQLLLSGQVAQRVDLAGDNVLLPGNGQKPGCEMRLTEVQDLERLSCTLAGTSEEIVGVSQHGIKLPTPVNSSLLQSGRYLSSHLQEPYWSTFLPAIYILITVTAGFPVISGTWSLIGEHLAELDLDSAGFLVPKYFAAFLDAVLYCCLAAVFATVHRFFTGRRLWTRYTARTVVIVESTANYKLLRAYLSKLRALAWRFTAFGVAGQNGADHFVHEMTHLAHSDALLVVGRPDGRLSSLAASESSVLMSVQQARYISSTKSGSVEAVCVGHNPWRKAGLWSQAVALPTEQRPAFLSERELATESGEHAPGNVMHKVADFVSTHRQADKDAIPRIGKEELVRRMGGQAEICNEKAQTLLTEIVHEQAEQLKINPARFEAERFFKRADLLFASPETSRSATRSSKNSLFALRKKDGVSVSQIMATLRGTAMQKHLADLQEQQRKAETMKYVVASLLGRPTKSLLRDIFSGWVLAVRSAIQQRETASKAIKKYSPLDPMAKTAHCPPCVSGNTGSKSERHISVRASAETFADCPEWRKKEEMRRYAMRFRGMFGFSQRSCFEYWRDITAVERAKAGRQKPHRKGNFIVGSGLVGKVSGGSLLAELALLEGLYESRIASAERLLAFFVLFHEAVRRVASLPFLSYDMDRSESRLRVASTPAPVGFVESLPEGGDKVEKAAIRIQNAWLRNRVQHMTRRQSAFSEDSGDDKKDHQPGNLVQSLGSKSPCTELPAMMRQVTPDPFPPLAGGGDSLVGKTRKWQEDDMDLVLTGVESSMAVPFGVVHDVP